MAKMVAVKAQQIRDYPAWPRRRKKKGGLAEVVDTHARLPRLAFHCRLLKE